MFDRSQFFTLIREANNQNSALDTKEQPFGCSSLMSFNMVGLERYFQLYAVKLTVVACTCVHGKLRNILIAEPR